MIVNRDNLVALGRGFQGIFQGGLDQAPSQYQEVAMDVTSLGKVEDYGWLNKLPNVREWLGDRVVHNLSQAKYSVRNKSWELTIGVDRDDIEDDNLGIYNPLFDEMGRSTGGHYNQLVFDQLKAGFATPCYDGQYFFDTDHPVIDATGAEVSVANTDGGAGAPWFMLDLSRAIKPIVLQKRKAWQFVAKTALTDDNVYSKKEFQYGVDARHNVGYGLWQMAWGSKQTLDVAHYRTGRESIMGLKGDHGRPLGGSPTHLVVGPSNEGAGLEIINAERNAAGATNVYRGTAKLLVVPWLA